MGIQILNKKTYTWRTGIAYFSVDRSSPLGNPFFMDNESQRDEVCDKYEVWFYKMLEENVNESFLAHLQEIYEAALQSKEVALLCWCAPKRCHAETIKQFIEAKVRESRQRRMDIIREVINKNKNKET